VNLAIAQSAVHVPHWKHKLIFPAPGIFMISYLNFGSIFSVLAGFWASSTVSVNPKTPGDEES
jgi:hypothetical protein